MVRRVRSYGVDRAVTIERVTAELFHPDGTTSAGMLDNIADVKWKHVLSKAGTASFRLPLDDLTTLVTAHGELDDWIVKFTLWGAVRFGCRLVGDSTELAVDGRRWAVFDNQPGLLSMLSDAVLEPEYGDSILAITRRTFGYMCDPAGPWYVSADWVTPPSVVAYNASTTHPVAVLPTTLQNSSIYFISFDGVDTAAANGTYNYFIKSFTTLSDVQLSLVAFVDDVLDVWIDGKQIINNDSSVVGEHTVTSGQFSLPSGTHHLAVRVRNWFFGTVTNSMCVSLMLTETDPQGAPTGTPLVVTDSSWLAHATSPLPGWHRASVLKQAIAEAQARATASSMDSGVLHLTVGFDDTNDSDGHAWTDLGEYTFDVHTKGLDEIATQLAEAQMDIDVDVASMTLKAWKRGGSDVSSTIQLKLGDSGDAAANLKSYKTTRTAPRKTVVYTQLKHGVWDQVAAPGATVRKEVGLSMATISDDDTAGTVAAQYLAENAHAIVEVTGETHTLVGYKPYVDFQIGDSIGVPAHRNVGTMKARAIEFNVDATGDVVRAWPTLIQDLT